MAEQHQDRFGEAVGLTWKDVDFQKGLIDINKTFSYNYTKDFAPTKNKSSMRQIPVSDQTLDLLKIFREKYYTDDEQDRIFHSVSNNAANKTLKKIVGRDVHIHSLRHTYASFLITQGVELLSISEILGYENLNITISVYTHQLQSLRDKNNDKIKSIFQRFGAELG